MQRIGHRGKGKEERGKGKEERGKRKGERGKGKEERGKGKWKREKEKEKEKEREREREKNMSYRKLIVWQKSKDLAVKIYKFTDYLPSKAKYSLADQMNRAAISIPSNIAEGHGRNSTKDYIHFLYISKGSLYELITQIEICLEVYPELEELINPLISQCEEIKRMLNKIISCLRNKVLAM